MPPAPAGPPHPLDELVHEDRVHRTLYTSRELFQREMERVFGGTWTYLAHESEIPEPDDFVRKRLGLRPVIVTRDRTGQVHGVLNRCTHRGATVCRVDSGNARRFVCPYHNWTFDNTGDLVGVPMKAGYGEEFDRAGLGLGRLRVSSYRGFVFGTLNAELPELEEHLGHAARLIDQWLDRWPGARTVVRHGQHRLTYRGNWKLTYDNSADGYHPGFSHASLLRMRKDRYGGGVDMQWVLGNVDRGLQTSATATRSWTSARRSSRTGRRRPRCRASSRTSRCSGTGSGSRPTPPSTSSSAPG